MKILKEIRIKRLKVKLCILGLMVITVLINYTSAKYPIIVENLYSTKLNKVIIESLSKLTNIIPFSLYDITLFTVIIIFIFSLIKYIVTTLREKNFLNATVNYIINCCVCLSTIYFLFIFLWGLNYNRVPFDKTIGLDDKKYTIQELCELYDYLIENVNKLSQEIDIKLNNTTIVEERYKDILNRANIAYEVVSEKYPTLNGEYGSTKPLLMSELFNYAGITGVYYPFTGQAGVNIKAPIRTIPATTIHEMAHQRGYAKEEEANFIAYLLCTLHPDIDFRYSGYMLALSHTRNAIAKESRELLAVYDLKLSDDVKRDINYNIEFWKKYQGKIEKLSSKINDSYLKSNGVRDGEKSYGRMVDILLNYYFMEIK